MRRHNFPKLFASFYPAILLNVPFRHREIKPSPSPQHLPLTITHSIVYEKVKAHDTLFNLSLNFNTDVFFTICII